MKKTSLRFILYLSINYDMYVSRNLHQQAIAIGTTVKRLMNV